MQARNDHFPTASHINAPLSADSFSPSSEHDLDNGLAVEELVIRLRDEAPHIHKLNHSIITIGRDSTNDIVLKTGAVSRHHARLEWRRGVWYVTDLDSTNGTSMENDLLEPHTMRVFPFEQHIKVGPYELRLRGSFTELPELTHYIVPEQTSHDVAHWRNVYSHVQNNEPLSTPSQKNFAFSMWPQKAVHNSKVFVAIQNEANVTQHFKLIASSDAALSFTSAAWEVSVPAGIEKRVAFIVHADARPLLGDVQHPAFEIAVETDDNRRQSAKGTVAIKPHLSQRMLLFGFTVLFMLLISYLVTLLL